MVSVFGRYVISTGEAQLSGAVGEYTGRIERRDRASVRLVINEIQYHPALGGDEFVETEEHYQRSSETV